MGWKGDEVVCLLFFYFLNLKKTNQDKERKGNTRRDETLGFTQGLLALIFFSLIK